MSSLLVGAERMTVQHKRPLHAVKNKCPNGGSDCRDQFTVVADSMRCPHCRTELVHPNHGSHVTGKGKGSFRR
jgi:hypothetical protein